LETAVLLGLCRNGSGRRARVEAQHRLHRLFTRLAERKRPPIAAVAVAGELFAFLWSVIRTLDQMPSSSAA
jgi:hypothetical protein